MNTATAERMRAAHRDARDVLGAHPCLPEREHWGWQGRTLGQPVTIDEQLAWLRLACIPDDQADRTFWDGNLRAEQEMPASVPRPSLRTHYDWPCGTLRYRAELYDHTAAEPLSSMPARLDHEPPAQWWHELRAALETLAVIATDRYTVRPCYLDWAVRTYLGLDLDTARLDWVTAHGDLHWANLCGPDLQILDWEGWGRAPAGYDAARLHAHSLGQPKVAERIRRELANWLETPAGTIAELAAIAELFDAIDHGNHQELFESLTRRASFITQQSGIQPGS